MHYPWVKVYHEGKAGVFNRSCGQLPEKDPFHASQGDRATMIKVMDYVPDSTQGENYSILFSMGESADPHFLFFPGGETGTAAFSIPADHLHLKGNGVIIARGSVNEMFTVNRKYLLENGRVREIKQPFYAVNLQSRTLESFPVYRSRRLRHTVTTVSAGENVNVLLAEFRDDYRYYLIRSESGLCGWIKVKKGVWINDTPIKDLYFHGD
ncbi:MAG: hypothetical protein U5N26_10065 [Candidatus Marinimicrobia bacterium]|nr:hypothetical protein [Candidatus Neomarinimicrobiota bacterium]